MTIGKQILSWDEDTIIEQEITYRLENWQDFGYEAPPDRDTVSRDVYDDSYIFRFEWDYMIEGLGEILARKNKHGGWKATVKNFGWQAIDGVKYFCTTNARSFLSEILPNIDCTFYIYNFGRGLAIQNYHHDSPTGREWYYILPSKIALQQ